MINYLKNSWFMPGIYFDKADDGGGSEGAETSESTNDADSAVLGDGTNSSDADSGDTANSDGADNDGDNDSDSRSFDSFKRDSDEGTETEESKEPSPWQAQTKGDNKTREDLSEYKTINEFVEAYDKLKEERDQLKQNSSAPEDIAEYGLEDEELAATFQELGVSKEVAEKVTETISSKVKEAQREFFGKYGGTKADAENWIRKTFGKEHVDKKNDMIRALNLGDAEFHELVTQTPIGNNPTVLKYLQHIGSLFGEDNLPLPDNQGGVIDEDEAKMRRLYPSMYK